MSKDYWLYDNLKRIQDMLSSANDDQKMIEKIRSSKIVPHTEVPKNTVTARKGLIVGIVLIAVCGLLDAMSEVGERLGLRFILGYGLIALAIYELVVVPMVKDRYEKALPIMEELVSEENLKADEKNASLQEEIDRLNSNSEFMLANARDFGSGWYPVDDPKYFNLKALDFCVTAVDRERAHSVEEALALYDDEN
ncbi:MAG: hypothetical protein ACOYJL_01300 [Tractidigestivibacter sp.]|jgi:hypothetical protein|uniref:hypothetical protein n=1 Tax=Tractidigestivibacter sp. TaxID=2847320 RepID=UPI003D92D7F8